MQVSDGDDEAHPPGKNEDESASDVSSDLSEIQTADAGASPAAADANTLDIRTDAGGAPAAADANTLDIRPPEAAAVGKTKREPRVIDPSAVPTASRYFLHDDRGGGKASFNAR